LYLKLELPTLLSMHIINGIVFWDVKIVAAGFSTMLGNVKILVLSVKYSLPLLTRRRMCKLR
jgi:hypothetical protein